MSVQPRRRTSRSAIHLGTAVLAVAVLLAACSGDSGGAGLGPIAFRRVVRRATAGEASALRALLASQAAARGIAAGAPGGRLEADVTGDAGLIIYAATGGALVMDAAFIQVSTTLSAPGNISTQTGVQLSEVGRTLPLLRIINQSGSGTTALMSPFVVPGTGTGTYPCANAVFAGTVHTAVSHTIKETTQSQWSDQQDCTPPGGPSIGGGGFGSGTGGGLDNLECNSLDYETFDCTPEETQ